MYTMMSHLAVSLVVLLAASVQGQDTNTCKSPTVEQRRMADDVRFASPFYVIGLPKTPKTEQIDNVCYTYFESEDSGPFFHIISVVYKNGTNSYHKLKKQDILDRNGLAEAKAETSSCVYHDYTLTPICNVSVFILYRCFIEGSCEDLDIGASPEVDARVVLAASTKISDTCRTETENNLRDTSTLSGGDYVILPQNLKPKCITKYGNRTSLNPKNALGSREIEDVEVVGDNRLADDEEDDNDFFPSTPVAESPSDLLSKIGPSEDEESEKPLVSSFSEAISPQGPFEAPVERDPSSTTEHSYHSTTRKTYAQAVKSNPTFKIVKKNISGVEREVVESWRSPQVPSCSWSRRT